MSYKFATKLAGLALATLAAGAFLAPAAQATPIQFYNVVSNGQGQGNARFEIGCGGANGSCANLLEALTGSSPLTWISSVGEMLAGPSDASPSSEASYVSGLLGIDVAAGSAGNVTPSGNNSPFEFMTSADYFMVKVGAGPTSQAYALLHNLGGNLDLYFTATGQAGGLSHYITFDPVSGGGSSTPVPEPGILGMFGLGLLALGVGYGLRRRRAM